MNLRGLGYYIKSAADNPPYRLPVDFSKANTPAIYLLPSWRVIMRRTTSTVGMSDTRIVGHRKVTDGHQTESKVTSCLKLPTQVCRRPGHLSFALILADVPY